MAAPHIVVAIVNFNSAEHVARLASCLDGAVDRAVVVDNQSELADRTALHSVAARYRWLSVSLSDANLGFGAGVNRAVAELAPKPEDAIWILNPDIEPRPGSAATLAELLWTLSGPEIVSPLILQGPRDRETVWFMGGAINWWRGTTKHDNWGAPGAVIGDTVVETGFITGAAPMLAGKTWSALGGFREDFFLYWEDADLSARAASAGMRMAVHCGARVRHIEGSSSAGEGRGYAYYDYGLRNRQAFLEQWRPGASWARRRVWDLEVARLMARALREPNEPSAKAVAVVRARIGRPRDSRPAGARVADSNPPLQPGIRVIPELRAAHVEEIDAASPRETWYFGRNYDMAVARLPPHTHHRSLMGACWALSRVDSGTLELWEPLWARYLPAWVLLAAVWRATRFGRPRSTRSVFFAIENLDPTDSLASSSPQFARLAPVCMRLVGWLVRRLTSRCVFGTPGAEAIYRSFTGPRDIKSCTILDLPARPRQSEAEVDANSVVFVGALERRKGIFPLMQAWETVEATQPAATLTIVGDGVEHESVSAWAMLRPTSRRALGLRSRLEIAELLDSSLVLVAPSVRALHWREQVGRPIQEAIRAGMTVVTTRETGLAEFLRGVGHVVLDPGDLTDDLPSAILGALARPLSREQVRSVLPDVAGRIAADQWLHDGGAE